MPQVSSLPRLQTACLRGIHPRPGGAEAVLALAGWQFLRLPLTAGEAALWRPCVGQAVQVDLEARRLRPAQGPRHA
ncbi:hypothetical protein [Ideonella oryzae]|uniref:Uncharacterized protein n=1 Tax=Ideonella oryzae TaxID=2937441 RepID=A0ABT1BN80_9BURK|nr:hypothetical protein [Ideonella oryzae]MCO5977279.1 hypothetical protein [Ideonella oryzae]